MVKYGEGIKSSETSGGERYGEAFAPQWKGNKVVSMLSTIDKAYDVYRKIRLNGNGTNNCCIYDVYIYEWG